MKIFSRLLLLLSLVGASVVSSNKAHGQFYSAGTNVLSLGSAGVNADFSATFNRTWSGHVFFSFNPIKYERFRTQHFVVRPQIRWWNVESYRGLFVGAHLLYTNFHVGIPSMMKNKYEGIGFGGGLDIGYALPLNERWNLEFQGGGTILYADYVKSVCQTCGLPLDSRRRTLVLPTMLAVSLVYLF